MRRIILALGIAVTLCNLTIGISYASICQTAGGARACGEKCTTVPDGRCLCEGSCTADEMKWVGGGKGDDEELLME